MVSFTINKQKTPALTCFSCFESTWLRILHKTTNKQDMTSEDDTTSNISSKKPRKIMKIKPSKYEGAQALYTYKKYWSRVFKDRDSTSNEMIEESRRLAEALPEYLYERVCSTLDIPLLSKTSESHPSFKSIVKRRMMKEPMISFRKCIFIDRELDSDTDVEICLSDEEEDGKLNIHQEFLSRPEREQITWATHYLQPEKEEEKSLIKKADDLTDRIAKEFCQYMKELGGDQQSQLFTPKAIKELFQIEFDTHVARSLRVVPKELPTIDEKVANVTGNPEKSQYAALNREITKDIRAERRHDRIKAFNQSLPSREQYRAPRNNTRKLWRSARHVPKDLVTLKTVWEGITNLRSVKEYCRWMIEHPEHRKPPYLCSLGMFDKTVLDTKLSFGASKCDAARESSADECVAPVEQIRRRLSQLADSS